MSVRETVRAWLPVGITAGVVGVAALVAIPLGGWDSVELQSAVIPEHPVGEPYRGHRVSTAIDEVYLTDEHPDGFTEREPGEEFLIVVATLENVTAEPQYPFGDRGFYAFTVPGLYGLGDTVELADYWVRLVRDGTTGTRLSPGVPDTVQFVFRVDVGQFEPGDEVAIGLTDADPEEADIYDGTRWVRAHVAVEVPIVIGAGR